MILRHLITTHAKIYWSVGMLSSRCRQTIYLLYNVWLRPICVDRIKLGIVGFTENHEDIHNKIMYLYKYIKLNEIFYNQQYSLSNLSQLKIFWQYFLPPPMITKTLSSADDADGVIEAMGRRPVCNDWKSQKVSL